MDKNGNIFATEGYANGSAKVREISSNGVVSTVVSNNVGLSLTSPLNSPSAITGDTSGNLYLADAGNNLIYKITNTGVYVIAGGNANLSNHQDGNTGNSSFLQPYSIACDSNANLYIADNGNHEVRKINTTTGIITTIAGSVGTNKILDGIGIAASKRKTKSAPTVKPILFRMIGSRKTIFAFSINLFMGLF